MKLIAIILLSVILTYQAAIKKSKVSNNSNFDYCSKIDTLIKERYFWNSKFFLYSDRIISEIESKTKIVGSYGFSFGGKKYCDTLFNEDIRKWSNFFNCKVYLPKARPTHWCDPLPMERDSTR